MAETDPTHALSGFLSAMRRADGDIEAVVTGGSMAGCIDGGTRVRIRNPALSHTPLEIGDIVVFLGVNRLLIAHRIVAKGKNWRGVAFVVSQGDSQWLCDMPIDVADVEGTVTAVWREGVWNTLPRNVPSRSWQQTMISRLAVGAVMAWARVSSPPQRRWLARSLLRLRRRQASRSQS